MRQQLVRWLALGAMSVIAACGGSQPSTAATEAATPQAHTAQAAVGARDVTALDVCARIPVAELAAALGGSPGKHPPNGHAYPGAESECWYEVARGAGRAPEVVGIFLYPPGSFASSREEGATDIPGLGDGAFRSPRTDIATVIVLKKDVAVIDARAGTPDHAVKVAELALRKLEKP